MSYLYELHKLQEKWLQPQLGFANRLITNLTSYFHVLHKALPITKSRRIYLIVCVLMPSMGRGSLNIEAKKACKSTLGQCESGKRVQDIPSHLSLEWAKDVLCTNTLFTMASFRHRSSSSSATFAKKTILIWIWVFGGYGHNLLPFMPQTHYLLVYPPIWALGNFEKKPKLATFTCMSLVKLWGQALVATCRHFQGTYFSVVCSSNPKSDTSKH
jgi:hypothetical protein